MAGNDGLNPFRVLSPRHRAEVRRQRLAAFEAEQRYKRVVEAYRELVSAPRYAEIREQLEAALGDQLHQLVRSARACAHCAPVAVRVEALSEIVMRPLAQLWMEAQRSRVELEPDVASEVPDAI
jgi:hypothetical protein